MKKLINGQDLNKEFFINCIRKNMKRDEIGRHFNRNSTWVGKIIRKFDLSYINEKSDNLNFKITNLPKNLTKREVQNILNISRSVLNRYINTGVLNYTFREEKKPFDLFLENNPNILEKFLDLWNKDVKQGEIMDKLNISLAYFNLIRNHLKLKRSKDYFSKCSKELISSEESLKKRNESIHKAWELRNKDKNLVEEFSNKMRELRNEQELEKHKELLKDLKLNNKKYHWQELKIIANIKPCSSNIPNYLKSYHKVIQNESFYEIKVKNILDNLEIPYIRKTRRIISPKELDFYIPSYNLAIEVNEIRGHNSDINYLTHGNKKPKSKNYHKIKTDLCREKGIRLIHITELDILEKYDQLKYYLTSLFNKDSNIIYEKDCKLKIVPKSEEREFLNSFHLHGYKPSTLCLGLYYNNLLVFVMSFSKNRVSISDKYDYELLRICNRGDYKIIGGASRCFNYFIKKYNFKMLVSYCDISKFSEEIYDELNMVLSHTTSPNYLWVRYDNHLEHYTKYETQKHKLVKQGYDINKSSTEIMLERKFVRFYDCGNNVYIYNKLAFI